MNNSKIETQNEKFLEMQSKDRDFKGLSNTWIEKSINYKYAYNFKWLGVPVIQVPQDIYAIQELIWKVKPDLIIETGIAHGGSLILSASMLVLLDYAEAVNKNDFKYILNSKRKVIGIDIDIREHNKEELKNHPMKNMISTIEGSSINRSVVKMVKSISEKYNKVFVILDSNHTHSHVLSELKAYTDLVSIGSYCVVCDTGIEDLPDYMSKSNKRKWGKGCNPKTAVHEFLKYNNNFEVDKELENKLMITSISNGFLKKIK